MTPHQALTKGKAMLDGNVKMLVAVFLLGLSAGQFISGAGSVKELEAQVEANDTLLARFGKALDDHLRWANQRNDEIKGALDRRDRLECMKARDRREAGFPSDWHYLEAAGVPCGELLGNRIRGDDP